MSEDIQIPKELEPVHKEVRSLADDIGMLEIESRADYDAAYRMMDTLYDREKKISAILDPIIKQAHATHKVATTQKKMLTGPIVDAINVIKAKMAVFVAEEKKRLEAEAKVAKEKLAEAGFDTSMVVTHTGLSKDSTGMVQVDVWDFEVTDINALPKDYMLPDMKKIRGVVTSMKDATNIPGVKVTKSISLRRGKSGT